VGVVLFEALTGVPVFEGSPITILETKEHGPVPGPCGAVPTTPLALDALVRALLDPDPDRRPDAGGIRAALLDPSARLGRAGEAAPVAVFVGRDREVSTVAGWLARASASGPLVAEIVGPSGIGKSALLRHVALRAGNALVLASACHPGETMPYKAL